MISAKDIKSATHVLVVDDDLGVQWALRTLINAEGFKATICGSAEEALETVQITPPDIIILDWNLPGMDGISALGHFTSSLPAVPVVMLTACSSVDVAIQAMKGGAFDYLVKPIEPARLMVTLGTALTLSEERRRREGLEARLGQAARNSTFPSILSCSPAMEKVFNLMEAALEHNLAVLIQGESGTGKELVAQGIHDQGRRRKGPFVALNAAALPEALVEGQLFGHEKGSFTGATQSQPGFIENAHGGTLFLDEVGDMPLAVQPKFLRCLEDGKVQRIGGSEIRKVDFRLIAATNRDLVQDVRQKRFRQDLYYRLAVFPIQLPPLRDRHEDILPLARHFFAAAGRRKIWIEPQAAELLESYSWPGNVRELLNTVARLAVMVKSDRLTADDVSANLAKGIHDSGASPQIPVSAVLRETTSVGISVIDNTSEDAASPSSSAAGHGSSSQPASPARDPLQPFAPPALSAPHEEVGASPAALHTPETSAPPSLQDEIIPLEEVERQAINRALEICNGNVAAAARALAISRATIFRYLKKFQKGSDQED